MVEASGKVSGIEARHHLAGAHLDDLPLSLDHWTVRDERTGPAAMNNQPIGSRCQVCRNRRKADAEHWVRQGMSLAQAAKAIGVNPRALKRHMTEHASPQATEMAPDAEREPMLDGPPNAVLDAIEAQLAAMLKGRVSQTQKLQILAEQRRLAVDKSRIVGPPPSKAVTVVEVEGLGELFSAFHEALKDFPGAREKLAEVWTQSKRA